MTNDFSVEELNSLVEPLPTPPPRYLMVIDDELVPFQGYGPIPKERPKYPVWAYEAAVATPRGKELGIRLSDLAQQAIAVEYAETGTQGWSTLVDWNDSPESTANHDYTWALSKFEHGRETGNITWDATRRMHVIASTQPS